MEQGNIYNLFDYDLVCGINNSSSNFYARTQEVKSYLCPSDGETGGIAANTVARRHAHGPMPPRRSGRLNYMVCIGNTAQMSQLALDSIAASNTIVGIFNFKLTGVDMHTGQDFQH